MSACRRLTGAAGLAARCVTVHSPTLLRKTLKKATWLRLGLGFGLGFGLALGLA